MENAIKLILTLCLITGTTFAQRTVFDNDRGTYYQYPYNYDYTLYGAYGGQPRQTNNINPHGIWYKMFEETIKSPHARFQHFYAGDSLVNNFPVQAFTQYALDEKRHNKVGLWVTKTIGVDTAKVQFSYTGFAFAENPILDVVHFSDSRYVKYFANEFARAILHGEINFDIPVDEPYGPIWKNLIIGIDNYDWTYGNYGYKDANGTFIYGTGFTWDSPYPQNLEQLQNAVISFQTQLKKYAPDVPIMVNGGGSRDTTIYDTLFKDLEGKFFEGFMYYFAKGYWDRWQIYWQLQSAKWMDKNDKITIFQGDFGDKTKASLPSYADDIRTMTCAYLIARSQNSFFCMSKDTTANYEFREIKTENYQYIKDDMGLPKAPFILTLTNNDVAYGLYKRQYDGGWVFLNLTGLAQTITLDGIYYDRAGNAITSFTIADYTGDYVRIAPQPRPQMVAINNRYAKSISGTVPLKMSCGTAGTTIRYTTDGSLPTNSSPIYTTPINLSATTTVKAIAFKTGLNSSFVNTAFYDITSLPPIVSFYALADTVTEYLKNGYALVKLSKLCSSAVSVNFAVSGTATFGQDYNLTNGTVTFQPYESYKVIRIPVIDDFLIENLETVRLTLSSPLNATLGTQTVFDYYIQDNEIGTLPISLTTFTAKKLNNTNLITWQTASETNNNIFELELSVDGENFTIINSQKSKGNSTNLQNYSYNDNQIIANTVYYRLKQTDFDGKFSFSKTISLKADFESKLSVYPNPFTSQVNISASKTMASLKIIGSNGQTILSKKIKQKSCVLAEAEFGNGFYILEVVYEDGSKENMKLLKE